MKRVFLCVALGAALLGGVGSRAAWCGAEAPKWGVIDMERVAAEYQEMQRLNQEFQEFQREQELQLEEKHTTRLLTDGERQEFLDLAAMGAPTEARQQRLTELAELSNEREKRMVELRKKEECTEEEAAERDELGARYEARMAELAALQAELRAGRTAKYEELSKLVADSVDNAIKAAAEEQKLGLVLRKDSVLYGGVEITDAVIEKLNAKGES
ncbi:MAG TPA: OmpH family outer membrane protein [Armatimonadota bacterium]|nr:OmpH family outer membrane protein [Armatimonadota bacterium]